MENEVMDFQEMKLKKIGEDLIKLYHNKESENLEKPDYIKRLIENSKRYKGYKGDKYATIVVLFFKSMMVRNEEQLNTEVIGKFIHLLLGLAEKSGSSTLIKYYYRSNWSDGATTYNSIKLEKEKKIDGNITVKEFCKILVNSCKEGKKDDLKNTIFELFNIKVDESVNSKKLQSKINSKQIILYGPPGTGKTREAKIRAAEITRIDVSDVDNEIEKTDGRIKLVQFHPSYSYFDFVEGIEAGENSFELKDKIFKEFADRATKALSKNLTQNVNSVSTENNESENREETSRDNTDKVEKYVLIIDEINRANMASVFGELLYALEYRGKELSTSGGTLVVPDNLYVIGTMNTADASIAGIDYAVRRRFDFIKMNSRMPDGKFSNTGNYEVDGKCFISNLYNRVRIDIQNSVARGVDVEDIMPGIAYFLVNKTEDSNNEYDPEHLQYKIDYEIVPLLLEYAKNGLFGKRYKIDNEKSLYELLKNMEYSNRLNKWIKEKNESTGDDN